MRVGVSGPHLYRLQRGLTMMLARLSRQSWLDSEKHSIEAHDPDALDCRVVNWTARTSTSTPLSDLLPCLLVSLDPRKALIQWVAHAANSTTTAVLPLLVENRVDLNRLLLPDSFSHTMTFRLMQNACQYALDSKDAVSHVHDTAMTNLVLWASRWHQIDDWCWLYLSRAVKALDPAKFPDTATALMRLVLDQHQGVLSQPGTPDPVAGERGFRTAGTYARF